MGSRGILTITSCLLVLSGCGIGRSTVRPVIYGRFEKVGPIIWDTVTWFEWQMGPDQDMTRDEAKDWVNGLGSDWRMAGHMELLELWRAGIKLDNWGPFENSGSNVWCGEGRDSSSALYFSFCSGKSSLASLSDSNDLRVFAVRFRRGINDGHFHGRVETSLGDPLIGATVVAIGTRWGAITNSFGEYTIIIPIEGSYTLIGRMVGFGDRNSPILEVFPGQEIEFDFTADNPNPEDPKGYSLLPITSGFVFVSFRQDEVLPDRFFVTGEMISDSVTGLQWRVGPDMFTDWYEAKEWVDGLGDDWRMPTTAELKDLFDAGIKWTRRWGPFENSGWWVWSGEVHDSSTAWYFDFNRGSEDWGNRSSSRFGRAFAVRSR